MLEIINLFRAGGIFMYGILGASLFALAVILQRLYTLWFAFRLNVEDLQHRVLSHVDRGE